MRRFFKRLTRLLRLKDTGASVPDPFPIGTVNYTTTTQVLLGPGDYATFLRASTAGGGSGDAGGGGGGGGGGESAIKSFTLVADTLFDLTLPAIPLAGAAAQPTELSGGAILVTVYGGLAGVNATALDPGNGGAAGGGGSGGDVHYTGGAGGAGSLTEGGGGGATGGSTQVGADGDTPGGGTQADSDGLAGGNGGDDLADPPSPSTEPGGGGTILNPGGSRGSEPRIRITRTA